MSPSEEPTTLASTIRNLDAQSLSRLLTLRPDLANPTPRDLTEVSSRASTHASIIAAISSLDRWRLSLLTALAALGISASPSLLRRCVRGGRLNLKPSRPTSPTASLTYLIWP